MSKGKITPNGVVLETHENATVVFMTEQGYDVELIPPIQRKGARTPDIRMNDLDWEMKTPKKKCIAEIERRFNDFRKVKRVLIITKTKKLLDFSN